MQFILLIKSSYNYSCGIDVIILVCKISIVLVVGLVFASLKL